MSEQINPEAMEPSTVQSSVYSDRNPAVTECGDLSRRTRQGWGTLEVPAPTS
jgi:hypothetical protein